MKLSSVLNNGGKIPPFKKIVLDSREVKKGDLFIAINGGVNFIADALQRGAALVALESRNKIDSKLIKNRSVIVSDIINFLADLAKDKLSQWRKGNKKIVAITGSNGKTTTKDMLYYLLDSKFKGKVLKTEGNHNNHIGVPSTIFQLQDEYDILILEIGSNHPGEINNLVEMVNPDFGYITGIGDSHLQFFREKSGVFQEKKSLFDNVVENNGTFIVNAFDPYLVRLNGERVISFGEINSDYLVDIEKKTINNIPLINNHILGEYNFLNLVAAVVLASTITNLPLEEWTKIASSFVPLYNRSSWIIKKDNNIFLDAYNANPTSMQKSLQAFVDYLEEREIDLSKALVILGDMKELGDLAEKKHYLIGKMLKELGIKNAIFVGDFAHYYHQGFNRKALLFANIDEIDRSLLHKYEYIFIKGSRALALEQLL